MRQMVLAAFSFYSAVCVADLVIIENEQGESYVLEVGPEDAFIDVVNSIQLLNEAELIDADDVQSFKVRVGLKSLTADKLSKKVRPTARSFAAGITEAEADDIAYILRTMANSSLPKIKIAEKKLRNAGDRIDHIHPFYFLSSIFTSEELKVCIRNLKGKAWVWEGFLNGILTSLAEEDARGNVLPFVHDFAAIVKVDASIIIPILEAGRWERFVHTLIEIVPREGGADRYNM